MDTASKWLALIGAVLVLTGIAWAGLAFIALEAKIRRERAEIKRIHDHPLDGDTIEDSSERLRLAGLDYTTLDDLMYLKQDIQLAALEHLKPSLSVPYILATSGAGLSVASAVLALFAS